MSIKISEELGVSEKTLSKAGIFNGFIDIDSRLYIDPLLLKTSKEPEMQEAHKSFKTYFEKVFLLLKHSKDLNDALGRKAIDLLTFPEIPLIGLGYSADGIQGSGIGPELAQNLTVTAKQIIDAGINEPTIFELVGLLEEGIGPDRISDMTASIIFGHLLKYSERLAKKSTLKQ